MLTEQTLDKLYAMKLSGMADAFKEQLQQPSLGNLSFEERFGLLVDRQWTWKEDRKMKRLLDDAKLKINACMEAIDYKSPRGIDRSVMMTLSSCDWIKKYQNVILTGPTGAGKTFLACAFLCGAPHKIAYGESLFMLSNFDSVFLPLVRTADTFSPCPSLLHINIWHVIETLTIELADRFVSKGGSF